MNIGDVVQQVLVVKTTAVTWWCPAKRTISARRRPAPPPVGLTSCTTSTVGDGILMITVPISITVGDKQLWYRD